MAHKAIWICDRCKSEQVTDGRAPQQFWTVAISANPYHYAHPDHVVDNLHVQVCRPCLEAMGIHSKERPAPTDVPERMSRVEEIVRELLAICLPEQP